MIHELIGARIESFKYLERHASLIEEICESVYNTLIYNQKPTGQKLFTCGNGGSAAEALHLTEELTGKFNIEREPIPGICLCADPTVLTCISNDYGYDECFARQLSAFANSGDILVVFSTSGNSANIIRALQVAEAKSVFRIGLLGRKNSMAEQICNYSFVPDCKDNSIIQEMHLTIIHMMLEYIEVKMTRMVDIRFWRTTDTYGFLSNFFSAPITIDEKKWPTTEHYYQAMKFPDNEELQEAIRKIRSCKKAKQKASDSPGLREDWEKVKFDVMLTALRAKFDQYSGFKAALIETGDRTLVEASPYDYIWGCGRDGSGQNLLGKAIMQIRDEIIKTMDAT